MERIDDTMSDTLETLNELSTADLLVDIGLFSRSLFVSEARREVELGKGLLWEIDSPRKDSDGLLSNLSRNQRPPLPGDRRRNRRGA
jgi:hypothetical protein